MQILQRLNREEGLTLLLVTHDPRLTEYAERVLHLFDGRIEREERVGEPAPLLETARELR